MTLKLCEICRKRFARYVCQECGREVCEVCFVPKKWLCEECYSRLLGKKALVGFHWSSWRSPTVLLMLGFLTIFIGVILLFASSIYGGSGVSGFVWVFPLPPVLLGTDQSSAIFLLVTALLLLLPFLLFIIFAHWFLRKILEE